MSNKALNWALEVELNHTVKIVLLVLANYANNQNRCWPGVDKLARICCLTTRSVIRSLGELVKLGLISKEKRYPNKRGRNSNVYILNVRLSATVALKGGATVSSNGGGLSDTVSPSLSDTVSPRCLSDTESYLSDTESPRGGGLSDTVSPYTLDNTDTKDEPKEKYTKEKVSKNELIKDCAIGVLHYLNKIRPGRRPFQFIEANIELITNRMEEVIKAEGLEIEEVAELCTRIICAKQREWGTDNEKRNWLRPATLFHKIKFHQYFGELPIGD